MPLPPSTRRKKPSGRKSSTLSASCSTAKSVTLRAARRSSTNANTSRFTPAQAEKAASGRGSSVYVQIARK